ncbi:MAG TPA: AMP-binding protein [Gemmataceae bacterium]|nr:AMP-binding protein [Gemmataceae bacterium]
MNVQPIPWVEGQTIGSALKEIARRYPNQDAVVFPQLNYRKTYREFEHQVERVAHALLAVGVGKGEHVGIWATNWPQWVEVQFAVAMVGGVLVNVNPAYRASELAYVLKQADLTTLFLTDRFKSSDYFQILGGILPELRAAPAGQLKSPEYPRLSRVISIQEAKQPGMRSWREFLAHGESISTHELDNRLRQLEPVDVANIQYTSGTTGFPKGAMLTHRNLLFNAFFSSERMRFTEKDRLCIPVPLYHCFGCVLGTLLCMVRGAAMIFPAESFDPLATLQAVQAERCTGLHGVPTMFIAELHHARFSEFDLSSLRTGIMAGSPCPVEIMQKVIDRMGAREITIGYGLTEASPIITQTQPDDDLEHRLSTVGTRLPGLEVKTVGPGTNEPVPIGTPGELMTRGHGVMKGYYNKPTETAEAITADGWLHSGDLAVETPDRYFKITGRLKDMIIRGGENIYPREIEEFLYTHPAILDVQVVGLPDERLGEEVCAWIRLKPNQILQARELQEYCQGKIAHFKVPRFIVFVDEYPTTVTGKIQKFKLREMAIERFGRQRAAEMKTA